MNNVKKKRLEAIVEKIKNGGKEKPLASAEEIKDRKKLLLLEGAEVLEGVEPIEPKSSAWLQPDKVIFCRTGEKPLDLSLILTNEPRLSYSIDLSFTKIERLLNDTWKIEGALFNEEGNSISEVVLYFPYSSKAFRDIVFCLASEGEGFYSLEEYRLTFSFRNGAIRAEVFYLTFASERLSSDEEYGEVVRTALPITWQAFSSLSNSDLILYTGKLVESLSLKAKNGASEWAEYREEYIANSQDKEDEREASSLLCAS